MNKKIPLGAALAALIIVASLTVSVTWQNAMQRFDEQVTELGKRQSAYDYLAEVDDAVRNHYIGTINEDALKHALASGYCDGVGDPYIDFLPTKEYLTAANLLAGKAYGFGIRVSRDGAGKLVVTDVQKNSQAFTSGLEKGDVITALDGKPLEDGTGALLQQKLAGTEKIILTLERGGQSFSKELTAGAYTSTSVSSETIGDTGYIRIFAVYDNTAVQFKEAYNALTESGIQSVVFDLRNNSGGSLTAAKEIIAFLLPRGPYGYYTDATGTTELKSEDSFQMAIPSVTLVNGGTAGEAELIAGALHLAGCTTLVGNTTAGRSYVQQMFAITPDNSAVKLSVAQLFLRDQSTWEKTGLTPRDEVSLTAEQTARFDTLTVAEDAQLQKALARLAGPELPPDPETPTPTTAVPEIPETSEVPETTAVPETEGDDTGGSGE